MNSSELRGYLTGLILGDGYIDKGITKRSFRIKTIHKDFAEQIKKDLTSCTAFNISIRYNPAYSKNGVNHKEYWELTIKSHPYFAKKYHHFFNDYKKRKASLESLSWLTPKGLANWYMSDGYICLVGKESGKIRERRIEICTDRYSKENVEQMKKMLSYKFDLTVGLVKRNNCYRLRIKSDSYQKFIEIVAPYVVPSMQYKLYLGYPKKPRVLDDSGWSFQENLRSAIALTGEAEG